MPLNLSYLTNEVLAQQGPQGQGSKELLLIKSGIFWHSRSDDFFAPAKMKIKVKM